MFIISDCFTILFFIIVHDISKINFISKLGFPLIKSHLSCKNKKITAYEKKRFIIILKIYQKLILYPS